jgi:hypothetical protein
MISEFDFKNKPAAANSGLCPRCGYNGGGGILWKIIVVGEGKTERGFYCDECNVFYPEHIGIYDATPERPVPADIMSYLEERGMDWFESQVFYEH